MTVNRKTITEAGKDGPFICTEEGPFNYLTSDLSGISARMIGRSLSRTVRYRGLTPRPYTVAQHSILGAMFIEMASKEHLRGIGVNVDRPGFSRPRLTLLFLLHDAPEAYVGDIPHPLKRYIERQGVDIQAMENSINARIAEALDIMPARAEEIPDIKAVDQALFMFEFGSFFGPTALYAFMGTGFGVGDPALTEDIVGRVGEVLGRMERRVYSFGQERTEGMWTAWVEHMARGDRLAGETDGATDGLLTKDRQGDTP